MAGQRLKKDIEFVVELDKMKNILRQTSLMDASRKENDAEHSWHVATMALILQEYAHEEIDICKVIKMLLVHDLVEIYAGDTFCYDVKANKDKETRELEAADKIFGILEEDKGQEIRQLWEEFEKMESQDAIFAAAMDRLQPIFSNYFSGGGTWKKFGIRKDQVHKRVGPLENASTRLWEFTLELIDDAVEKGYILDKKTGD